MNIKDYHLHEHLPKSIDTKNVREPAEAICRQIHKINPDILLLYGSIDELPSELLDHLSALCHVDNYDSGYSLDVKRKLIKDSILVHKHKGTKLAIKTHIANLFGDSHIEEWYEYGGNPFTFRMAIDGEGVFDETRGISELLEAVKSVKNVRSQWDRGDNGGISIGFSETLSMYMVLSNAIHGTAKAGIELPLDETYLRYTAGITTGHSYHKTVRAGPVELSAVLPVLPAFAYIHSGFSDIPANLDDMPEWMRSITEPSRILYRPGIAYGSSGRQRIPLAIPDASVVYPSPTIATGKSGRRLYGIALPEDSLSCIRIGHAGAITGRGNVLADMGDLAEWIASIGEPSRVAVRIAVESVARGRKILHTEMPQKAAAGIMLTASVRPSGRKSVGTATEDIPDFMRGFLESSTLAPRYAVKIIGTERRRFFPALPTDADASMLAGFAMGAGGRKSIPLAPPGNALIGCIIVNAHARTGRIIVGADRCDLLPGRRTRAHVGIMQAGLSAVG
ncbi:MAG: phage tail protein I [Selenomonadaceae bacterium]|nr:phage tail protein I [Selenomonadaceae bacterium]